MKPLTWKDEDYVEKFCRASSIGSRSVGGVARGITAVCERYHQWL